jgi:sensor domain CHASE-containing protein
MSTTTLGLVVILIIAVLAFFCGYYMGCLRTIDRERRREEEKSATKVPAGHDPL